MKTCCKCNIQKSLDNFYKDIQSKGGYRADCKACKNQGTYRWRESNKERYNKSMRDYQAANPLQRDDCDLKRKYGVSREWFDKTLIEQDNKCAICQKTNSSTKRRFAVDHNHLTKRVRGILCYNCNRLLHGFDNLDLFDRLLEYILKHKDN